MRSSVYPQEVMGRFFPLRAMLATAGTVSQGYVGVLKGVYRVDTSLLNTAAVHFYVKKLKILYFQGEHFTLF